MTPHLLAILAVVASMTAITWIYSPIDTAHFALGMLFGMVVIQTVTSIWIGVKHERQMREMERGSK